jgi:methionyl-tRNA synthetase
MSPEQIPERDVRQILSGIREYYEPEQLIGKQFPFVTNLEPRTMRGLMSHGMILAAKTSMGSAVLLNPDKPVSPGSLLS